MNGGRITNDEKATVSMYIGIGIGVILVAAGIYFYFLSQQDRKNNTGFDPNRPIPTDALLKHRLSPEEYRVVRGGGTQTPTQNEFWDNVRTGLYVDVITGEPLFSSADKFDAGVGMPTFTKPISKDSLVETPDPSFGMQRTEVRAKLSSAHLGHLFADPQSPTGQRYIVNSAAFHFIPVESLQAQGYGAYQSLFGQK